MKSDKRECLIWPRGFFDQWIEVWGVRDLIFLITSDFLMYNFWLELSHNLINYQYFHLKFYPWLATSRTICFGIWGLPSRGEERSQNHGWQKKPTLNTFTGNFHKKSEPITSLFCQILFWERCLYRIDPNLEARKPMANISWSS